MRPVEAAGGQRIRRRYRPARDYVHPFDGHSLIIDLVRCPQSAALMREVAPKLYALASDPESDVRTWRLDELTWGTPRVARDEAPALAARLPGVAVLG